MFVNINNYGERAFYPGNVLRFPAMLPYESVIEMMFFDCQDKTYPYGLIVTTGYRAGLIFRRFSSEALLEGVHAVSTDWVRKNWGKIYEGCNINCVMVADNYTAGELE